MSSSQSLFGPNAPPESIKTAEVARVHEVLEMWHSGYFYSGRLNRSGNADAGERMNHCESGVLSTDSTLTPPSWPMVSSFKPSTPNSREALPSGSFALESFGTCQVSCPKSRSKGPVASGRE